MIAKFHFVVCCVLCATSDSKWSRFVHFLPLSQQKVKEGEYIMSLCSFAEENYFLHTRLWADRSEFE